MRPPGDPRQGPSGRFAGSAFLAQSEAMERRTRLARAGAASLSAQNDAAVAHLRTGRPVDAVAVLEALLVSCREQLGPEDPETLVVEGNLAVACLAAGRWEQGIDLMEDNVRRRDEVLGSDHPSALAACDALACALRLAGRLPAALDLHLHVVERRSATLGPGHPHTLLSRLGLALARADAGEFPAAVTVVRSALRTAAELDRSDARVALALRAQLGWLLTADGRPEEGYEELRGALARHEVMLGRDHPATVELRGQFDAFGTPDAFAADPGPGADAADDRWTVPDGTGPAATAESGQPGST